MSEKAIGNQVSAKEYQKELMKNQPKNRPETRSNAAQDNRDTGSRPGGGKGNMEGQGNPPTRGGGSARAAQDC